MMACSLCYTSISPARCLSNTGIIPGGPPPPAAAAPTPAAAAAAAAASEEEEEEEDGSAKEVFDYAGMQEMIDQAYRWDYIHTALATPHL